MTRNDEWTDILKEFHKAIDRELIQQIYQRATTISRFEYQEMLWQDERKRNPLIKMEYKQ